MLYWYDESAIKREVCMKQSEVLIVSSRLPVTVRKVDGKVVYDQSSGGLATGVAAVQKSHQSLWIGWPGIASDELTKSERADVTKELHKRGFHPVFLSKSQVDEHYLGYSNATLWPLFHYFYTKAEFNSSYWAAYDAVNKLFAKEVQQFMREETRVWVHDYQLLLLPKLLRAENKQAVIGFFMHTPFPSYEIFRLLPEREELLEGMLGANLIGFHTYDYARHFLSSVRRILGVEHSLGTIHYQTRTIHVDAFPIGIDYKKFAKGAHRRTVKQLLKNLNVFQAGVKIILSVDRADYSKGIPERLDAFELFLRQHPEYLQKVHLILLAVPSRSEIEAYKALRETIEQKVSRINGEFSTTDWAPVIYRHQSVDFDELISLYALADVMMVTPLRDGMNLVAKEYIATRHKGNGVLLLSEMAGVATEVPEALLVNPNNTSQVARTLHGALQMPLIEQHERMKAMQNRISEYTIQRWAQDFLNQLDAVQTVNGGPKMLKMSLQKQLLKDYASAQSRLILLDYDGTLRAFVKSPDPLLARPTRKLKRSLKQLASDPNNKIMIVSGRPKSTLELFFKDVGLGLIAEHGGWMFDAGHWIKSSVASKKWKKDVLPTLHEFATRTPGARVEEKDFSLVWHYRQVSPDLAYVRKEELKRTLRQIMNSEVDVFEGSKILEVKPKNMHKGALVTEILTSQKWDFIMVIGDDYTDEDMFTVMPERAYSIHVGGGKTAARYQVDAVSDVHELIARMCKVKRTN